MRIETFSIGVHALVRVLQLTRMFHVLDVIVIHFQNISIELLEIEYRVKCADCRPFGI